MTSLFRIALLSMCLWLSSCGIYGFKGISIPSDISTYFVDDITRAIANCPVDLDVLFAEALRQKVREQSRLVLNDEEPDVAFLGSIAAYRTVPVAPKEGNTTSLNRLEITLKIEFINYINEEENWKKSYSAFQDYDSNADFTSIEENITDQIIDDITERIFNDAFTNW